MLSTGNGSRRTVWRFWIYVGLIVGGAVSIAANIGYTFIPPRTAPAWWPVTRPWVPADYTPPIGDVGFAAFCPIAIFITTEVMTRPNWTKNWLSVAVRAVSMALVALPVAVASYLHLCMLLLYYSNIPAISFTLPLTVDGLMLVCTAALQMTEEQGKARGHAPVGNPGSSRHPVRGGIEGAEDPPRREPDPPTGEAGGNQDHLPAPAPGPTPSTGGPSVEAEPSARIKQRSPVEVPLPPSPANMSPVTEVSSSPVVLAFTGDAESLTAEPTGDPSQEDWPTDQTAADSPVDDSPEGSEAPVESEPELPILSELADEKLVELARGLWPVGEATANGMRTAFGVGTGRGRRLRDAFNKQPEPVSEGSDRAESTPESTDTHALSDVTTITSALGPSNH